MQNAIQQFIDKQKKNNIPEDQIEEALFIAMNVAVAKTTEEIKNQKQTDSLKELLAQIKNPKELFNLITLEKLSSETVNEKGEKLMDVLSRNFGSFLNSF